MNSIVSDVTMMPSMGHITFATTCKAKIRTPFLCNQPSHRFVFYFLQWCSKGWELKSDSHNIIRNRCEKSGSWTFYRTLVGKFLKRLEKKLREFHIIIMNDVNDSGCQSKKSLSGSCHSHVKNIKGVWRWITFSLFSVPWELSDRPQNGEWV